MKIDDRVIVIDYGVRVEGVIIDTAPCSVFPAMAGQDGTMYLVKSAAWLGNQVWLTEDKVQEVEDD